MAKLTHSSSVQIVESALRRIREPRPLSSETRLGEILLTPDESELFRTQVHAGVKAEGFEIELGRIPTEPHFTVEHVAHAVCSLSGLAGNSGTDDP
jgi:hypothetical protein